MLSLRLRGFAIISTRHKREREKKCWSISKLKNISRQCGENEHKELTLPKPKKKFLIGIPRNWKKEKDWWLSEWTVAHECIKLSRFLCWFYSAIFVQSIFDTFPLQKVQLCQQFISIKNVLSSCNITHVRLKETHLKSRELSHQINRLNQKGRIELKWNNIAKKERERERHISYDFTYINRIEESTHMERRWRKREKKRETSNLL